MRKKLIGLFCFLLICTMGMSENLEGCSQLIIAYTPQNTYSVSADYTDCSGKKAYFHARSNDPQPLPGGVATGSEVCLGLFGTSQCMDANNEYGKPFLMPPGTHTVTCSSRMTTDTYCKPIPVYTPEKLASIETPCRCENGQQIECNELIRTDSSTPAHSCKTVCDCSKGRYCSGGWCQGG